MLIVNNSALMELETVVASWIQNPKAPSSVKVHITKREDRKKYDERHGGAFDRGSADSYYGRPIDPHYYVGATHTTDRIDLINMTTKEIEAYMAGYQWNERFGDKKNWN